MAVEEDRAPEEAPADVFVDGELLTRTRLAQLVDLEPADPDAEPGTDAAEPVLPPVEFDEARGLPAPAARALVRWLAEHDVKAEVRDA